MMFTQDGYEEEKQRVLKILKELRPYAPKEDMDLLEKMVKNPFETLTGDNNGKE